MKRYIKFLIVFAFLLLASPRSFSQSGVLVQHDVTCSGTLTSITCSLNGVTAGNTLIFSGQTKRNTTGYTWTISDTMNIAGTSGWHCVNAGPDVPQGISGLMCAGFPRSSGNESVTITTSTGSFFTSVLHFLAEFKPNVFGDCKDLCTFINGIPDCCSGAGTTVPVSTDPVTAIYKHNFSIANAMPAFPETCGGITWTSPAGTPQFLDGSASFYSYVIQPNTQSQVVHMTLNCGTGDNGGIVWGGAMLSSEASLGLQNKRRSQVY